MIGIKDLLGYDMIAHTANSELEDESIVIGLRQA
jgi:hypothetical protein